MTSSRLYRPKMAVLSRKEEIFLGEAEEKGMTYLAPKELHTRRTVADIDAEGAEVTYSFSHGIRNNLFIKVGGGTAEYGAEGMSYRMLYDFLCRYFNSGEYFIDTYFSTIFTTRSVSDELDSLNASVKKEIADEMEELEDEMPLKSDGTPDMRYRTSKRYASLSVWKNPVRKAECARVAEDIKQDIVHCLASGRIPLRQRTVSEATREKRLRLIGLDPNRFFFASGQLISHLQIFVALEET